MERGSGAAEKTSGKQEEVRCQDARFGPWRGRKDILMANAGKSYVLNAQRPRIVCEKVFYGDIVLYKSTCPECREHNFEELQEVTCTYCGLKYDTTVKRLRVEPSSFRKRGIHKAKKQRILAQQGNCCYWCGREFGEYYLKNGKIKQLQIEFDHKIPFSYTGAGYQAEMVASCNLCNRHKHDKMFINEKQCRKFLLDKIKSLEQKKVYVFLE